jgi:hypothetical protein
MNVGSELLEAQLENIATVDEAGAGKESGRVYFNPETKELLAGDGSVLIRYRKGEDSIGDMKHSMLTEAQFQAEVDTTWILADGRDVTGSDFSTVTGFTIVPDARGQFLRGLNNGRTDGKENPDGGTLLGIQQDSENKAHSHNISGGTATQPVFTGGNTSNTTGGGGNIGTGSTGGAESRPTNVSVNIFIKINRLP